MKKCPYCAEEIQDEAIVCKHCGRDLRPGVAAPVVQVIVPQKKGPSFIRIALTVILLAVVCIALIGIIASGSPKSSALTATQTAIPAVANGPTATMSPTGTPVYWDSSKTYTQPVSGLYTQILGNQKSMTNIQFKDYAATLKGKRLRMTATINEVHSDNTVYLTASEGGIFDSVYLSGLPKDMLLKLNKGQIIVFDASIVDFQQILITIMNVNNPVVYSIN